jgi:hypothetical protein
MATKSNEDLTKHTLFLRSGDYDVLREKFPGVGAAVIIRRAVSKLVDSLERVERPSIDAEVDL